RTPIGASTQMQITQRGKRGRFRVSSLNAFLGEDVMTPEGVGVNRRRLRVLFNSAGLRAVWQGNKAVGVEYIQNGETKIAWANKGVIVSAGLRSSPFLMHSGVGPVSLLESLNIPVIFNNPNVGQGLADQPSIRMFYLTNPEDTPKTTNTPFASISW